MRTVFCVLTLATIWSWVKVSRCEELADGGLDLLLPYTTHHGPQHRTHRQVRDCQHIKYGNVTHSKHKVYSSGNLTLPLVQSQHQLRDVGEYYYNKRTVTVILETVNNPVKTFSVLEPNREDSCRNGSTERATVRESAQQKNCILATNAGFFNTHSGECLGNIFSDGHFVHDSGGVMNVHFGLTADGYIYVGYLSELDLLTQRFRQLVGGVLWILREGEVYIDESIKMECPDTEETGTLQRFADVRSARLAVGHDKDGRILVAAVNGKTDQLGVNLYEMASIVSDLGFVNAVNLDGGGSMTVIINNTLVSYPSDKCQDKRFNCERAVSTILCVHEPECDPVDCSGHGVCQMGQCNCTGHWSGPDCVELHCSGNCSGKGTCTEVGCICESGRQGETCSLTCDPGMYGTNCSWRCCCQNRGRCDPVTGECTCTPGFSGQYCQTVCPYGFYGANCRSVCDCDSSCFCDPVTGSCNSSLSPSSDELQNYRKAGSCVAREIILSKKLVPDQKDQYRLCVTSSVVLGIIAATSIIINIVLLSIYLNTKKHRRNSDRNNEDIKKTIRKFVFHGPDNDTETDSEESGETTTLFQMTERRS